MPAKSKKQLKFMQAVANNPEFAKKVGVPTKVGKEFTKETKVKTYKPGGKVTTPEKEKARIKEMAKEDRFKKILERDMKLFGPNEESTNQSKTANEIMKSKFGNNAFQDYFESNPEKYNEVYNSVLKDVATPERTRTVKPAPKKGNPAAVMKKKGGKIGMGMTKNNYKTGGKVSS